MSNSVVLGRSVHGGTGNLFELNPMTRYILLYISGTQIINLFYHVCGSHVGGGCVHLGGCGKICAERHREREPHRGATGQLQLENFSI